ncbi:threonine/serine dehydratase [Roseomonas sp. GC11]|uniref:threonine/serine dehydratase n=1 Tax=Roseomonas sp. GC11 TaxID=2950546 RepID=UPI00210A455D|nr:threonine/serine dehydratase [Roseomonas sp. GC11]MCQ4159394.1 threonine/serine dehydratase [Roseomonas sp. GC11]
MSEETVTIRAIPPDAAAIRAAAGRIAPWVRRTPLLSLPAAALGTPCDVTLKLELLQASGSFKPRGAFNRILSARAAGLLPPAGVIAASGGNHGAAVAYAARALGIPAEIFVPEITSPAKLARIQSYGATLVQGGATYDEARQASEARAAATGALIVHAYDQPEVLAGQGTLALELEEQAPELTHILVATGGGGLIGGVASWYGERVEVISVEPEGCPTLFTALREGYPVPAPVGGVAADSLGARQVGRLMFEVARRNIGTALLVPDEAIRAAQKALWEQVRLVAEPGGATALAALLCGAFVPPEGARVGVVVCGSNTDPGSVV